MIGHTCDRRRSGLAAPVGSGFYRRASKAEPKADALATKNAPSTKSGKPAKGDAKAESAAAVAMTTGPATFRLSPPTSATESRTAADETEMIAPVANQMKRRSSRGPLWELGRLLRGAP